MSTSGKPRERWLRRLYVPAYGVGEAAMLSEVHSRTVSRWFYGYATPSGRWSEQVLGDRPRGTALSYVQLVEVAFVARFRQLGVTLERVRIARDYLMRRFGKDYPFAQLQLRTDGAHILKDLEDTEGAWVDSLLVASAHGQIAWAEPIEERIRQFDYELGLAIRWHPRGRDTPIVIDPQIAFGSPILEEYAIPTMVIKGRIEAGEDIKEIEGDFGITPEAIRHALAFEGVESFAMSS